MHRQHQPLQTAECFSRRSMHQQGLTATAASTDRDHHQQAQMHRSRTVLSVSSSNIHNAAHAHTAKACRQSVCQLLPLLLPVSGHADAACAPAVRPFPEHPGVCGLQHTPVNSHSESCTVTLLLCLLLLLCMPWGGAVRLFLGSMYAMSCSAQCCMFRLCSYAMLVVSVTQYAYCTEVHARV